ncbi:hypothetical protein [Pseudomonas viridiflava]|uniref:hypothetical protein n=1 Tax=Pseudomonas viridiflava TaxID=33069 RepID=UPI00197B749E|nr:hypothetical protein [Pseudomonas viridiflava]
MVAASFQILALALPAGMGCLSSDHRRFRSAQALVLARATVVFGAATSTRNWFESHIRSRGKQQSCTLMNNFYEFTLVMDTLFRLEHGIF